MNRILFLLLTVLISLTLFSQSTFYIQNGSTITKVDNGDLSRINVKEWQVRLYKKGASTSGTSYWGKIKGSAASEVMGTLKKQQQFELDFNKFIGKGNVEDEVYTHFNPLGPIAITDSPKASDLSLSNEQKEVADLYERAIGLFYTGLDVKNNLDVIIKGEQNLYADIGSNFMQYSEGLKDAVLQIRVLENLLTKNVSSTIENLNKKIKIIERKLNDAQIKQNKVVSAVNNIKTKKSPKSDHEFYVFLTTTIDIKPKESQFSNLQSSKTMYIISKPILHSGKLTDDMQSEKKQFNNDIQRNFSEIPDIAAKLLNNKINVHFTKPYSKELLKQSVDCYEAIEGYKNSIKEALEGLTKFDFLQLE